VDEGEAFDAPEPPGVQPASDTCAVVRVGRIGDVRRAMLQVGLPVDADVPVIVVCGGADDLNGRALAIAESVLGRAVAGAAEAAGAVVVEGGTASGVMQLLGEARRERPAAIPVLVGVAPAGQVLDDGAAGQAGTPLDRHHTHFVLADGEEWGSETGVLFDVAEALSGETRAVVVVAGGGEVTRAETLEAVRRGLPVFVIEGTGGAGRRTRSRRCGIATASPVNAAVHPCSPTASSSGRPLR
jgi:hypothetical protein